MTTGGKNPPSPPAAAAIDYDLDGWPDFYLTACDGTPLERDSGPNRLYRSLAANYTDVTQSAGVGDPGFAQGVAVGDYNSDGFPDIFVGNFGSNRLLCNNGDGTFSDVSDAAGIDGTEWTTSVAIGATLGSSTTVAIGIAAIVFAAFDPDFVRRCHVVSPVPLHVTLER